MGNSLSSITSDGTPSVSRSESQERRPSSPEREVPRGLPKPISERSNVLPQGGVSVSVSSEAAGPAFLPPGLSQRSHSPDTALSRSQRQQPQEPASTPSVNRPESLSALSAWQEVLLGEPEGSIPRKVGERLQYLQNSCESGQINQATFVERANEVLADMMKTVPAIDAGLQRNDDIPANDYSPASPQINDGIAVRAPRVEPAHPRSMPEPRHRAYIAPASVGELRSATGDSHIPSGLYDSRTARGRALWVEAAIAKSIQVPRSLSDLPSWRKELLDAPEGSLSRQFGERLQDLQHSLESVESGQIDQATFQRLANQIAADLKDCKSDLPYSHHHVATADVGLQYLRFSEQVGAVARPIGED